MRVLMFTRCVLGNKPGPILLVLLFNILLEQKACRRQYVTVMLKDTLLKFDSIRCHLISYTAVRPTCFGLHIFRKGQTVHTGTKYSLFWVQYYGTLWTLYTVSLASLPVPGYVEVTGRLVICFVYRLRGRYPPLVM